MTDCIFCKIVAGEIPAAKIYEDDNFIAFLDLFPATKGHTLVIPKQHCKDLLDLPDKIGTTYMPTIKKIAQAVTDITGAQGFVTTNNNGAYAGQSVFHLHFHIIPRYDNDGIIFQAQKEWWKPQKDLYEEGEMQTLAKNLSLRLKK